MTCCNSDRTTPKLLSQQAFTNAPRPTLNCEPITPCTHCLLAKFQLLYPHFFCPDNQAPCIALNMAECYVGGIMSACLKEQAIMFAAAHFLEIKTASQIDSMNQLNALASGESTRPPTLGADFWQASVFGQAYWSIVQTSNPRIGILCG